MNNYDELKKIVSKERVIFDIEDIYQTDGLSHEFGNAEVLVFALTTDEVSGILKFAYKNNIDVTPRGAGTNLVGSTIPQNGGIILDLSKMQKIIEIDEKTQTATVESGVVLEDFQKYVENRGYFYPPDPGEKKSSIGGNISTNAGGMRAVKYGVTRDYVYGLEVVLADGTVMEIGTKNIKDASGLQLKELIIGSEGTLCVITKAILKLIPKPQVTKSVLIAYKDLESAIETVLDIKKLNATAIEFIEREVVNFGESYLGKNFPAKNANAYLLLTFDGTEDEVENNIKRVKQLVQAKADFIPLVDKKLDDVWNIRGCLVNAVEAVSEQEPIDIVVPINKIVEFINFVSELERDTSVKMIRFGHAGDGNIHLCVMRGTRDLKEWSVLKLEVLDKLYKKAYELGGLTSGEHGIGISKRRYFFKETDAENLNIMNKIKVAFDEKNILNNKKSYVR